MSAEQWVVWKVAKTVGNLAEQWVGPRDALPVVNSAGMSVEQLVVWKAVKMVWNWVASLAASWADSMAA